MLSVCIQTKNVYAGNINSEEARIIGVASGTFEYNGESYVAANGYVSQLSEYLSKDDIDLTAEQADAAINKIYSNIETGVKEGYIVKISGTDNNNTEDNIGSKDKLDGKSEDNSGKKSDKKNNNESDAAESFTLVPQVISNDNGTIDVYMSDGNKLVSFDGVLMNTGYSINTTIIIVGVLAMLFVVMIICCTICVYKNKVAANDVYGT